MVGIARHVFSPFRFQLVEKRKSKQCPCNLVRLACELDCKLVECYPQPNQLVDVMNSILWEQCRDCWDCRPFSVDLFIFYWPFVRVCLIGLVVGTEFVQNGSCSFEVECPSSQLLLDFTFMELPLAFEELHEVLFQSAFAF